MPVETIGHRIKAARENAGLNQSQLARGIQVTPTVISAWEAGLYNPRPSSLVKVAEFLKEPLDWLATGEHEDEEVEDEDEASKPATVSEILAKAKVEIAGLLGVAPNKIKLDMSLTG